MIEMLERYRLIVEVANMRYKGIVPILVVYKYPLLRTETELYAFLMFWEIWYSSHHNELLASKWTCVDEVKKECLDEWINPDLDAKYLSTLSTLPTLTLFKQGFQPYIKSTCNF